MHDMNIGDFYMNKFHARKSD